MKLGKGIPKRRANRVFIIAEVANAHEGSVEIAKKIVEAAANAGADAIKFQRFIAERLLAASNSPRQLSLFEKLMMRDDEWGELVTYAKEHGLYVFADVFDEESAESMERRDVDGYKIHSSDMANHPLLQLVASFCKPTLLAASGSTHVELSDAIDTLKKHGIKDITLMHGFQGFPTGIEDSELNRIRLLGEHYGLPVGYADHSDGSSPLAMILPMVAIGSGAVAIEKHIALGRELRGEDYESSLNPGEFSVMVANARMIEKALGGTKMLSSKAEKMYRRNMKKKIVARVDIAGGTVISEDMLTFKRIDADGYSAKLIDVVGKSSITNIEKDELITLSKLNVKIVILIAVRMGSTRLPAKAALEIDGQSTLAHLIDRIRLAKTPHSIVVCTTRRPDDDRTVEIAREKGVKWFRGSKDNVIDRYIKAAEREKADVIVRVTGDDILRDPEFLDKAVERHLLWNADYTKVNGLPYGIDSEIIALSALKKAHELAEEPAHSGYMTWYLDKPEIFEIATLEADPSPRRSDFRLTLDYSADLELMKQIFRHLYKKDAPLFSLEDVIDLLDSHPELAAINSHIQPEDLRGKVNTRLKLPKIH